MRPQDLGTVRHPKAPSKSIRSLEERIDEQNPAADQGSDFPPDLAGLPARKRPTGDVTPVRMQLSRRKGFSLQAHSRAVNGLPAINVARPSKWGNPWAIKGAREAGYSSNETELATWCARLFREWISGDQRSTTRLLMDGEERVTALRAALPTIRGKNLACWCPLDGPCHADVLLDLANRPKCEAA
jgi:hypothetical protein